MKKEIVEKKLKKYSANQLLSKLEKGKLTKIEKEVVIEILQKRGKDVSEYLEDPLKQMKESVDLFVDELIADKRTGVYTQVVKALGGRFESDLDELLEEATKEQLKDALAFKGVQKKKEIVPEAEKPTKTKESKKPTKTKVLKNKHLTKSEVIENVSIGTKIKFPVSNKISLTDLEGEVVDIFICNRAKKEFFKVKTNERTFIKPAMKCKTI